MVLVESFWSAYGCQLLISAVILCFNSAAVFSYFDANNMNVRMPCILVLKDQVWLTAKACFIHVGSAMASSFRGYGFQKD